MLNNTTDTGEMASEPSTLIELLRWRACCQPHRTAYSFLVDGETEKLDVTYAELDHQAQVIGGWLEVNGFSGKQVLLLYPPGIDYIAAFFGCLYAGAIAVPAYPPRLNKSLSRLETLAVDSQSAVALTTSHTLLRVRPLLQEHPILKSLRWQDTTNIAYDFAQRWQQPAVSGDTLAFLQYTSGSTAMPKGVMVSHSNLLCNQRMIKKTFGQSEQSVIVSWLPLYHDMGLIGGVLQPLYLGAACILMSPMSFLQRPFRWLQAISRYKATTSGGPDSAYGLCLRKISPQQRETLDLSSWTVAFNGSEPVRAETLEEFALAFQSRGFRRNSFYPCYGLAEATLLVSGKSEAGLNSIERPNGRPVISCGAYMQDQKVIIVDPESSATRSPGQEGEVWVAGPGVAQGYWNRPEETERTFRAYLSDSGDGPFLRTGDLGLMRDGELYVTARMKDLIIIRGVNYYPQDIELTVEHSCPQLRQGCGAAFSVDVDGQERLVLAYELGRGGQSDLIDIFEKVCQAVGQQHGVRPYSILLTRPGIIPKTSSGKIQRQACRAAYVSDSLNAVAKWTDSASFEPEPSEIESDGNAADVERWLVAHLAARLALEPGSIDTNRPITDYGIDSLMAIDIAHGLESSLGVSLSAAGLIEGSSITELVERAFTREASSLFEARFPSETADEQVTEYRLSYGQQSLLFLHHLAPDSVAYNLSFAARVRSELNIERLQSALQVLVGRHPLLRTAFLLDEGVPFQRVSSHSEVDFEVEDASAWGEAALNDRLTEEAHRPFDLSRGSVLRVRLFVRSSDDLVLLLSVHHIAADFWSLAVLGQELGILYSAQGADDEAALVPPAMSYAQYTRWQADMIAGPEGERLWSYWRDQLKGKLTVLNLPTDKARPPIQTYRGASHTFKLSEDLSARLAVLSRLHGTTLYMTLLAAFHLLLHRYTGQDGILVGSPTASRRWPESSATVGYFVNTLTLSADFSGSLTFSELLAQVRKTVLGAIEHQDYPFALLVERLQPEWSADRSPLCQAMFVFQKAHLPQFESLAAFAVGEARATINLGGLRLESMAVGQMTSQFDLTLTMAELGGTVAGSLQYNADLFNAATIARMAGHFQTLLEGITANADSKISSLPLLTSDEIYQLLAERNDARADYGSSCIHHLFETQVDKRPGETALACEQEELTYEELNIRANRLAHRLRSLGVRPELIVGVCLERSVDMVVALLAVLKAGGAYLPLDPAYPKERLGLIIEDARIELVITREPLAENLPGGLKLVRLDADREEIARESCENLSSEATPGNLAYVIYTSGSTGKPKGVQVSHHNVSRLMSATHHLFRFDHRDVWTLFHSFAFDFSVWEIWGALCYGGKLVVVPYLVSRSPESFRSLLSAQRVTVLNQTPSAFYQLMAADEGTADTELSLRLVIFGGEALDIARLKSWFERRPHKPQLVNMYGITETTVHVTYRAITEEDVTSGRGSVIGHPIADLQAHVLDSHMHLAPLGVPGELYIGGEGVARSYLNRPSLSAERFVPDPFSDRSGARLYRSGDLARRLADGDMEYLGRCDHQVKIRGFRVELGEIEALLKLHPLIKDAALLADLDSSGHNRLVGYVACRQLGALKVEEVRAYLKQHLPDYMLPSAIALVQSMPLTSNGKLDRKQLQALAPAQPQPPGHQPQTQVEQVVAGIWAELLATTEVGRDSSFFELGGHSLLATRMVTRLRKVFGVEVGLRQLFERPTLREVAQLVEAGRGGEARVEQRRIRRVERGGRQPLSYAQQRLWFLSQMEPGNPFYNCPGAVRMEGELEVGVLERTIEEVVRRHEVLRTRIVLEGDEPVQEIGEAGEVRVEVIDLEELEEERRGEELRRVWREEGRASFELSVGPMMRVKVVKVGRDEQVLVVTMHHIVSDGWSVGVLMKEVGELYSGYRRGEEVRLEELEVQYVDYAVWQREEMSGGGMKGEEEYWRERLRGIGGAMKLPGDREREKEQRYRGGSEKVEVRGGVSEEMRGMSRREGVTLFMSLLAAFNVLLHRYTGAEDVVIGSPIAGRTLPETEKIIGCFVNMLALRADLSGNPTFLELLSRVREMTLDAFVHQNMPFEKIVEELQPDRSQGDTPLFQTVFAFQNTERVEMELEGLKLELLEIDSGTAKFGLELRMEDTERALVGDLIYSTGMFDETTIRRMGVHFNRILESIVEDPGQHISDISMLTETERHQLLVEWNGRLTEPSSDKCVQELFEVQARRTPAALALVCGEQRLTYRELNCRANRLAHYLRSIGVGRETLVGLFLERSVEAIVGLLGILKAGGAYVPLDPSQPKQRLSSILEDAQLPALLTEQRLTVRLPESSATIVCLDAHWQTISRESDADPSNQTMPENLVYLIYTSGSTGKPKGVAVEHRNLTGYVRSLTQRLQLKPDASFASVSTMAADLGNTMIFPSLAEGGRLHLISEECASDPAKLEDYFTHNEIDYLKITPTHLEAMIADGCVSNLLPRKGLVLGGEACGWMLLEQIRAEAECEVFNHYGPTETTVGVITYRAGSSPLADESRTVPLGRPLDSAEVYILDKQLQPVPSGFIGDLYIGGRGLARGYINRQELTADRFIPNPFSASPGARLYRSGDLARFLPDGNIEFLGRSDHQVKIRGFRVELGEIEALLKQHPLIKDAALLADLDSSGHNRLVGYVACRQLGALKVEEVRAYLKQHLPDYMLPSAIALVQSMPLTSNGKLDRKQLQALAPAQPQPSGHQPQTQVEQVVAGIWAELLATTEVGRDSSFFELGGHSLLATRMVTRLRKVFGVEVGLRQLFERPTLREVAQLVEAGRGGEARVEQRRIRRVERGGRQPLSYAQQRLWFLSQMEPDNPFYNCPGAVRMEGELEVGVLERTIEEVVRRHEVLRTRIVLEGDEPVQEIGEAGEVRVEVIDLEELEEERREEELRRVWREEGRASFELSVGPMMRVKVVKVGRDEQVLVVTMHHIVSDGWSVGVLMKEVGELYSGYRRGEEVRLEELEVQYVDYAVWQREEMSGGGMKGEEEYWREWLRGIGGAMKLPGDREREKEQRYRGGSEKVEVRGGVSEEMRGMSRREGVTLFMSLLAVFQTLLHYYTDEDDMVVGTDVANRNIAETEKLIGFFVNQLVLRTDLSRNPTFRELLARVRDVCLDAFAHQDLPFDKLVEILKPERSLKYSPLFQVKLVLQNTPADRLELPGLKLEMLGMDRETAQFDLLLNLTDTQQGLSGALEYNADIFNASTVSQIVKNFQILLEHVVEQPDSRLDDLKELLAQADRRRRTAKQAEHGEALRQRLKAIKQRPANPASLKGGYQL